MKPSEDYILNKPEPYKSILIHLKFIIERHFNKVVLKFKWSLPFYYIENIPFCYLNYTKGYVDLAFMKGYLLTNHLDKLNGDKRKLVKSLHYRSIEEIEDQVLIDVLNEAYKLTAKQ